MHIQVTLSPEELNDLISSNMEKMKLKKAEVAALEKDIRELNARVIQFKKALNETSDAVIKPITDDNNYSDKWQWVKKIKFALELSNKALTANEIYDVLCEFEPSILLDKRKAISTISGTLSAKSGLSDEGKEFVREKGSTGEYTYRPTKAIEILSQLVKPLMMHGGGDVVVNDMPF